MTISRFRALLLAGALACMSQSPAFAASQLTNAFLANLQANVAFLDHSSRAAIDHAQSLDMRSYASSEVEEQSKLASALTSLMPLIASTDTVVTGRSVAVDGQTEAPAAPLDRTQQAANGRPPMAQAELDKLAALSGTEFDNLFWRQQLDALTQIEADYRAYIANGDDPVLVEMAHTELPKIVHRLELLSKL